jgi:NADPH-dependent 2,4-dienoyl-CoA reductase/sulfur reductase-like enzyme
LRAATTHAALPSAPSKTAALYANICSPVPASSSSALALSASKPLQLRVGSDARSWSSKPPTGELYAKLHRDNGVDLRLGAEIAEITGDAENPVIHLAGGAKLQATAIVVGIGVVPNDALAAACGLDVENGIIVDEHGRTSDPSIYAAGDVTRHFNPLLNVTLRLESWQNAQNQAIAVARNIAGHSTIYAEVPWFWSDQYGINMQITGIPTPDATEIIRGDLDGFNGLLLQMSGVKLIAAIGLNATRDLRFAKQIIGLKSDVDPAKLADPTIKLSDIVKSLKP